MRRAQCLLSLSESYRVRFFAGRNRPGSEATTGDIRYVSPITQAVCTEYSVLCQDKWLPVRLHVGVCLRCRRLSIGLEISEFMISSFRLCIQLICA